METCFWCLSGTVAACQATVQLQDTPAAKARALQHPFLHQADLKISASVASLYKIILTHSYPLKLRLSQELEKLGSAHPFLVSPKRQVGASFCYKNFPKTFLVFCGSNIK